MQQFIDTIVDFLDRCNMTLHMPTNEYLELDDTGRRTHYVSCNIDIGYKEIDFDQYLVLQITTFFTLLDTYIDSKYPNISNKPFNAKYFELKSNSINDFQIILTEVYRILINLRNSLVHNLNTLHNNENVIRINNPEKNIVMECSKECLEFIYTLILIIVKNDLPYSDQYIIGLMRHYYNIIMHGFTRFMDFRGDGKLFPISNSSLILKHKRYYIEVTSKENDSTILLKEYRSDTHGRNYLIKLNNKTYLVPEEILNNKRIINKNQLRDWMFEM